MSELKELIDFEQFAALDLRVGKILEAGPHPNADKLLVLKVDLGELGTRQILAGIKQFYEPTDIIGKSIIIVANLKPRVMRGLESQGMLLAAVDGHPAENLALSSIDREIAPGTVVS